MFLEQQAALTRRRVGAEERYRNGTLSTSGEVCRHWLCMHQFDDLGHLPGAFYLAIHWEGQKNDFSESGCSTFILSTDVTVMNLWIDVFDFIGIAPQGLMDASIIHQDHASSMPARHLHDAA
mmetsp:Transcript_32579/g.105259  ORF Transcript_32579/g.105259 Transcript_32579/m.105259 type:complete len:122 (+) Transcript_32579:1494-1859(+)